MEIPVTQLPPGDPRLVEAIVGQLKSKGIFDQFRKECLADVDTKPAFQNLRQRVEGHVNKFLEKKTWKNDMNKNQLRDGVRKHVNNLGILDSGIDAIITQVVNPKIKPLILPYVEDTVYAFLQIDKPKRERKTSEPQISPVFQEEEPKPKPVEIKEEKKPSLLPMETDVISSEEDDILARESPDAGSKTSSSSEEEEVKTVDENAQDGFEACPPSQEDTADAIASTVERLQLSEDDSKSAQASKQPPPLPLFEDQSLDSISSNSSGLTFSPLTVKGSPDSKKSNEDAAKSDQSPRMEVRSATSTPLVDEKPVDDNSQSLLELDPTKEFQPSEKMYSGDEVQGNRETSDPSLSTVHSSARPGKDGTSLMSFDEDSLESKGSSKISTMSGKSEVEGKPKFEKSEGEVTSSSSDLSDGDTKGKQELLSSEGRQQQQHSDHDSSHKSSSRSKSDHKKRRDSHSRDRDREREKEKDSRHHRDKERKHSKSRDDHHSHRDKDKKHHRRDKDHDGDRERSRSHHHQSSSSSHKESSGSKDKERSSHHSSGKSSEGKSRSSHSSDKSEGKPNNKMESKSDEKSETKAHKKDDERSETKTHKKDDEKSETKTHKKDDKRQHSADRKSDSKSDRNREKLSEERTDKKINKPDKKAEKKERSDDKHNRKSESKSETKSDSQESKLEGRPEVKKIRPKDDTETKLENKERLSKTGDETSSKQKKPESNIDSKRRKRNSKHKGDDSGAHHVDSPEEKNGEAEVPWSESKKNGVLETIGKECAIDPHVLGLNGDKIIVEDGEGNFLLVTYEDDTDSTSCDSQITGNEGVSSTDSTSCDSQITGNEGVSSSLEIVPDTVKANSDEFLGFEAGKTDTRLFDYLSNVVKVPDDMDLECDEWFEESDLHMTIYEGTWEGKVPINDFLRGLHQLGAVIRNEKGEVEDHSVSGLVPVTEDIKEDIKDNNNIQPLGKKRRISNSSSISSSSSSTGSPKHKRIRRESSLASDTSQMLEQDAVIVSGYALLTPEDDGNRSMSREYDIDYSQKIPNYSPLSPASDSSADERKSKNRVAVMDTHDDLVKPSVKIDQKTDTSWPSKEAKFSA